MNNIAGLQDNFIDIEPLPSEINYMRWMYTLLFYLMMPFIWLRLLWRSRRNPDYAKRWGERLGHLPDRIKSGCIWWHAVSVGEVLAAVPLIKAFQAKHPGVPILVTTMTPTGSVQVLTRLGDSVQTVYVPYDIPHVINRFLAKTQPKILIVMETELWPNLFAICHKKNIPIIIANARMSEKSARGYGRFKGIVNEMLGNINQVAVQNRVDGERFIKLGLPRDRMEITGTVKFDITISADLITQAKQIRESWGTARPTWIAASTHPGEEEIIVAAMQKILKQIPNALLVLVPRHPDRAKEVISIVEQAGLKICTRSSKQDLQQNNQVFLVDTLGELILFYATADIAFVGGSLINKGGHNVLEPAALAMPIITGKSMFNFAEIEQLLLKANALIQIDNADQLANQILELFNNISLREKYGKAGQAVIEANRGATQKQLALIEKLFHSE